ncbi:MAG: hypothetical protein AAF945_00345 [Actinomycetota bacterium]
MTTTLLMEEILAGDVLEVKTPAAGHDVVTVLVLLATDEFLVLDPCDGSTPFVVPVDELVEYRKFDVDADEALTIDVTRGTDAAA